MFHGKKSEYLMYGDVAQKSDAHVPIFKLAKRAYGLMLHTVQFQ
jgi:hypothetical protein